MSTPHKIYGGQFSHAEVDAAMCVWEWLLEERDDDVATINPHNSTIDRMFASYGRGGMRGAAIQAGLIIEAVFDEYAKHLEFEYAFDIEFVPMVCRHLDWEKLCDSNQHGMGDWMPDIPTLTATLIAMQAMRVAMRVTA